MCRAADFTRQGIGRRRSPGAPMMRRVVVTGLGMVTPLGCGVEPTWQRLLAGQERDRTHREIRSLRSAMQDRRPDSARRRLRRHLQCRSVDGAQGAAQGRRLHSLRHVRQRRRRSTMPAGIRAHTKTRSRAAFSSVPASAASRASRETALRVARHAVRAACRRSSFPAGSSISRPAMCRSRIR